MKPGQLSSAAIDLHASVERGKFGTILADPPWQFMNRTGKMAPEHKRLMRYPTMKLEEIMGLPVSSIAASHYAGPLFVGAERPAAGGPERHAEPGVSPTRAISSGTRPARTADLTAAVSASTSGTSRS